MKTIAKTTAKPLPQGYNEGDPMPVCDFCGGRKKLHSGKDCPVCGGRGVRLVAQGEEAKPRGDRKPRGTKTKGKKAL